MADKDKTSAAKAVGTDVTSGKVGPEQGVPSNTVAVPIQVVSRDELAKPEYSFDGARLEVKRDHPNYIFDNQRNQQAAENTVEVAAGIRNMDGTMNENHPLVNDADPSVVKETDGGLTTEEKRNEANLKK